MKKTLFNAAKKYLIETCRSQDKYALIDYQLHLVEMYSEPVADILMEEVSYTLFNKYPDSYQWLNSLAENYLDEENDSVPEIPLLTADDLAYMLKGDELMLTEGKDFKFHTKDLDKLVMTSKVFSKLKEALAKTYSNDKYSVSTEEVHIEDLVEVSEGV